MTARSLGNYFSRESVSSALVVYGVVLSFLVLVYRLLSIHWLSQYYAGAFTITMLFLPLFCYFLQRDLIRRAGKKPREVWLILSSMTMIWITATAVATFSYWASQFKWAWYFTHSSPDYTFSDTSWYTLVYRHLLWYTVFGLPGALLARGLLWWRHRMNRKG